MKFLENHNFDTLSSILSVFEEDCLDGSRIDARLESYSCKLTSEDKKQFGRSIHKKGVDPQELTALSPPCTGAVTPPSRVRTWSQSSNDGVQMVGATSRKTLWYLKSTLNHSYGLDYDFSTTEADDFAVEPNFFWVKNFIDSTLTAALSSKFNSHVRQQLWASIEAEIVPQECEIYSYNPDSSPEEEPTIWSFQFFFFNKRLKRIVFFSARSVAAAFCVIDDNASDDESYEYASVEVY
ncbi:Oidioi.mRNA.OKI2018_I69.XSR.g14447.t1.cds [Oikopleura dioica]|uniref:Repressor of RNA polymerase III transcription MAF1 n=1 Tax=Oikopleura dioica TaxID=34765 RepID=A0ABN7SAB5_OIKDI|nr:Oidioi.mRNA.OKI2018_I69.XSR.g14447.t1.cds [Oikopleura dioica]